MALVYSGPEIMEMAIATEEGGREFYGKVAKDTENPTLSGLFSFLAEEESKHIAAFREIAQQLRQTPQDLAYNWAEAAQYLDAIIRSRYFLGHGKSLSLLSEAKTPVQALDCALAFEKETLLFYMEVLDMVGENTKPAVRQLIAEEKSHIAKLSALREALQK